MDHPKFMYQSRRKNLLLVYWAGLQIRVCIVKLFSLFLIQNICCGYSKEPIQWDGSFEHPKHMFKLMGKKIITILPTGPRSTVSKVSGNRSESDCRSRGCEFDPGPVPYFRGDWSWNNFYGHSPPFRWIIQEGLLSVTSKSMCTKFWLTACSNLPRKKCG